MVAEALGENELHAGVPLVGKAGHYLFNALKRVGLDREDFRLFNVVACRPPNNKLAGMPYESQAVNHCRPNLDSVIAASRREASERGLNLVILTLGKTAFKRVMGFTEKDAVMREDYLCYPFWSPVYECWVIAADHPSYLMRGNHHLISVLQFAALRATEIAEHGLKLDQPQYLLDPEPAVFKSWVASYLDLLERDQDTILSYDIETPMKQGESEEGVEKEDEDADQIILRVSFCYRPGNAVSVPWRPEYLPFISQLFATNGAKMGWNNCPTPDQRVLTADLRWVPAGELKIGDLLVGMDEFPTAGKKLRRYRQAVVTHAQRGYAPVFRVTFDDGSHVKVTGEHRWLVSQHNRTYGLRKEGGSAWIETSKLKVGQEINRLFDTWDTLNTYDAGYLAGFFDGEGYLSTSPLKIGASQKNGPTLDRVLGLINRMGFRSRGSSPLRAKDADLTNFVIPNGINGSIRFLGSVRPSRLMSKFHPESLGAVWHINTNKTKIAAIESLGLQEIVELSTDQATYILEGFAAHNCNYDDPRVRVKTPLNGTSVDAMLAWHVLNSALPKGLGFVTPFYVKNILMWKHLSDAEPAFYNAKDADMALRNYLGIQRDLKDNNLWGVFDRHVIQLNKLFAYMSAKGVTLDQEGRATAETQLKAMLNEVQARIEAAVPLEAKALKVYKKTPKSVEGLIQTSGVRLAKVCPVCETQDVAAKHFKSIGKKRLKAGEEENLCVGRKPVKKEVMDALWARVEPFALSKTSLERYQEVLGHKPIYDPKEKKTTFDEKAMMRLMKRYPDDPLYPEVGQFRKLQKLLTTYIGVTEDGEIRGGLPTDKEGVIHTTFTHNPSTLRSASQNPNLQNLPRPGGPDDPATIIRNLVVARPGNVFLARDFSGIEAVLVGYAASDPGYMRLARHDVHSFYTAYALHELDGRVAANDLPLLSWDDAKLFARLAEIKKEFKEDRNALYKHLVHGANFMQGARGAAEKILNETGKEFPVALVQKVMNIYFELFPAIKKWHIDTLARADRDGYIRNPFGYVHRFYRVYEWEKIGNQWQKEPGPDANKVIAFWPQSSAAGIIKDAMLRMFHNHFEVAGQYIRLLVHDEIFMEVPEAQVAEVDAIMKMEMERPIQCMPMMPEWKMGDYLTILTEAKVGNRWGSMK